MGSPNYPQLLQLSYSCRNHFMCSGQLVLLHHCHPLGGMVTECGYAQHAPAKWLLPLVLSGRALPQWFAATIPGAHQCSGYTLEWGHIHNVFTFITTTEGLRSRKLVRVSIQESSAPVSITARTHRELVNSQFYMWPLVLTHALQTGPLALPLFKVPKDISHSSWDVGTAR